ncbi:MAG: biosynthetic-type acetolactate synthase large subunit [Sphaerochaeta sp.]|jgi:acetolactate synthase-1/2/3 large subunit|nr:biosynthetic-type acetolactate synthase large subunit [Sphaerochaeta sp.]MCI2128522.1 biosynthetic-type acetolactate synthase large subunit [Sphaerochaeta sp.]
MEITGAQIIIECLVEQGVNTVFGYPGGTVLPLYDALYQNKSRIRHILTAHEQGASHAADGYARSTGKVGVCIATSGPGATNLVTGIATAYMDSVPMVAITGNVPLNLLGRDAFQEVDITGITMPITKHNYIVKDIAELAATIRNAFHIARSGRPGPVLVDVTKDVMTSTFGYERKEPEPIHRYGKRLNPNQFDLALKLLYESKRPMCYIGGGVISSNASEQVRRFLDLLDSPACFSMMGAGAISTKSPRCTGMVGMHGTKVSNITVSGCDLLVSIGARFSDRVIGKASNFAHGAKIIQIDVDSAEFDKNVKTFCHLAGDAGLVLEKLNKELEKKPCSHQPWMETVAGYKKKYPVRQNPDSKRPREILEAVQACLKPEDFVTTEVGQNQLWSAMFLEHEQPRHFLTSGGLGTMGYGTGAAIGTQLANPKSRVFNIAGDGCLRMNSNELTTAVRYQLPIIIVLMDNHALGNVRQWQTLFYQGRYSETTLDTPIDWIGLARAYGAEGFRIGVEDDPKPIIEKALALGKPVILDCQIPLDDKVYPMAAPGTPIENMMGVEVSGE